MNVGKPFVLKWRLSKHKETHASPTVRNCHYFNNKKPCPFENIGCKFNHVLSKICIYNTTCSNALCQHQHEEDHQNVQTNSDTNDDEENNSNSAHNESGFIF